MSYILEALRKSERERRLGEIPSLPALNVDAPHKRPNWMPWLLGLTLLLTVNAAIIAGFWLQGREAPPSPAARSEPAGAAPKPVEITAATTPPSPLEQKLAELENRLAKIDQSALPGREADANAPSPPPAVSPDAAAPTALPAPMPQETKTPPAAKPKAKPRREAAAVAPEDEPAPPDEAPVRRKAKETTADSADLPKAIQALKINVLAYSSIPEERFAVINMSKHFRGDSLPGGITLVDILADGLVLELDGERYRIRH